MPKKKTVKTKKPKGKKPLSLLTVLIVAILLLIGGYMIYSVIVYQQSEQEKEGFFACNEDGTVCELSQHIHADIDMNVCGEHIVFPKEKGRTDEMHTHKETNLMHWHARLRVEPETREPLDPTRRRVQAFLDQMEYEFPESCPTNPDPTLTVLVNDVEEITGLDYVWQDGDTITVTYQ